MIKKHWFALAVAGSLAVAGIWFALTVAVAKPVPVTAALGDLERCHAYGGLPSGWGEDVHAGMVRVPGGTFTPGTLHGLPEERPGGTVDLEPFWIDRTEVTNAQFAAFVAATGYVTEAEREGGAAVFHAPAAEERGRQGWWRFVEGASWRHPEGPGSRLEGRENQPVVQVTYADATAYAHWLGRTLPTEAQWEFAASGQGQAEQLTREPRDASGAPTANFWQGRFPFMNTQEDGFVDRAPVGCFPANGYGLYDLIGNVWEWTRDPFDGLRQLHGHGDASASRAASSQTSSQVPTLVIKGGSFLCAANYCQRYRATARHPQERSLGAVHVGFRTVLIDP